MTHEALKLIALDRDTRHCRHLVSVTRLRELQPMAMLFTLTGKQRGFEHLHALDCTARQCTAVRAPCQDMERARRANLSWGSVKDEHGRSR